MGYTRDNKTPATTINMIPRIKSIEVLNNYKLQVTFDDDVMVIYDVEDDINTIAQFKPLMTEDGLFKNYQLDESRTCISWTEEIDLPSDTIREYGERV